MKVFSRSLHMLQFPGNIHTQSNITNAIYKHQFRNQVPTNLQNGTPDSAKYLFCGTHQNEPKQLPSLVVIVLMKTAKIYPRKVTLVPLFVGKELNRTERLISVNSYEPIR